MQILHKIRKIATAALAVSLVMVTCFSGRISADTTNDSYYMTLSGYKGRIGIVDGGNPGGVNKGDTFSIAVRSSLGHSEDVSGLKVSWSVNDSSAVSITNNGFNKSDDAWEATVKILKAGTHQYGTDGWNPTVYATVNGHKLSDEIFVYPDATKVQKIGLNTSTITINGKGKTATDKITFYPENTRLSGTDSASSSNSSIATASYHDDPEIGAYVLITAVANGTVNIIVKDSNGAYASCKVTVTGAGAPAYVCDTTNNFSIKQGATYQFMVTANKRPSFSCGSNVFKIVSTSRNGNKYYFKVKAIGKRGNGCGFYINGSKAQTAIATIK